MKSFAIYGLLLLICHSSALPTKAKRDIQNSAKLLYSRYSCDGVQLVSTSSGVESARALLEQLELADLSNSILQAKWLHQGLLFEMDTPFQAQQVMDNWQRRAHDAKTELLVQTEIDFFAPQIDVRSL